MDNDIIDEVNSFQEDSDYQLNKIDLNTAKNVYTVTVDSR